MTALLLTDMFPLTPFSNNILIALLTLVYILIVMELAGLVRDRLGFPEVARKIIHIAAASWLLFWPLFDTSHWSWRLNVAIPVVYIVKLFYLVRASMDGCEKQRYDAVCQLTSFFLSVGSHSERSKSRRY